MVLKFKPWGDTPNIYWDEENEQKFWKHGIRDLEVEQCFERPHTGIPNKKAKSQPERYKDRYVVRGATESGRKLVIIVQYLGDDWIRPITGWDDK